MNARTQPGTRCPIESSLPSGGHPFTVTSPRRNNNLQDPASQLEGLDRGIIQIKARSPDSLYAASNKRLALLVICSFKEASRHCVSTAFTRRGYTHSMGVDQRNWVSHAASGTTSRVSASSSGLPPSCPSTGFHLPRQIQSIRQQWFRQ